MLSVLNFIGRVLLSILTGSWIETGAKEARNFTLATGAIAFSFALGLILNRFFKLDAISSYVVIPVAVLIFTFVVETIRKEIEKHA